MVSDASQVPIETVSNGDSTFDESVKLTQGLVVDEPIKFDSHGRDEQIKRQVNEVSESNTRENAVDEWPEPKKIHTFYFVRHRQYDDPKLKSKLDLADKELQKMNQARSEISEALKAKWSERAQVSPQLKSLTSEDEQFRKVMDGRRKEMAPLQQALGKLNTNNYGSNRDRGFALCSSEEELDRLIQSLNNRIQHESIPLNEEKQIIREINQLQGTREKVIANAAMRAKIQESLGQKELMGVDIDGVRKEQQAVRAKIRPLKEELKVIDNDIDTLKAELVLVTGKRDKAYEGLQGLRKQRDAGNSYFYQGRTLLNKARELAAKKDIASLNELCHTEMEKFMSQWNNDKAFRDDYERRILRSLDSRELSRDGRIRNPNEKPLVAVEEPKPFETETVTKVSAKQPKEDLKSLPNHDSVPFLKGHKEGKIKEAADSRNTLELAEKENEEKKSILDKPQKLSSVEKEVDAAKLKEMKREEEMVKAKMAFERKKKLAEKAAAKAAVRAEKEAEKKLKEREKKAKKKAAVSSTNNLDEPAEPETEVAVPKMVSEETETPLPKKSRDHKENIIRDRRRMKAPESRPKVTLKRKKATNYWVWAVLASLLVLLFLVLGYYLM